MFNWREFGHWSDQFPGHPNAINSIVAVTDNVVITACEDGVIRAVHLYPHRFVGMKISLSPKSTPKNLALTGNVIRAVF